MVTRPKKVTDKPDFFALLDDAKLPETTKSVCLRGDLAAEHEQLDAELETLIARPNPKMGDDGRVALRQRLLELEEQMKAATYPVRLRAMPKPKWRKFKAEHPPRTKADGTYEENDAVIGVNTETVWEPLLRACMVDPVLTDEQFDAMQDKLTDRQFQDLSWAAWLLNRGEIDVPFSRAASRMTEPSGSE